eukprot:1223853-Prymnesium_polylepis.1
MAAVPCDRLDSILADAAGTAHADFFSLDVEGSEVTVLRSINPRVFKVVIVETFQCCPPGLSTVAALKKSKSCQCVDARADHDRQVASLLEAGGLKRVASLESINHINH